MYDILEVLFFHQLGRDQRFALDSLREAFNGDFEVEALEFMDESRQVIRIIATSEEFESAADFDSRIRELAGEEEYHWKVIGAVPVGESETVLS
jgi:hypothetical protein